MSDLLKNFYKTGSSCDAYNIIRYYREKDLPHIALKLGQFFSNLFSKDIGILMETGHAGFLCGNYDICYDLNNRLTKLAISEKSANMIMHNKKICIPYIYDKYIHYNPEIVKQIISKKVTVPVITFTITTCKRFDLFQKSMNSFLNCCEDLHLIDEWICVDDNSSLEDRQKMQSLYPFFKFYFKTPQEKGHPRSMNIIKKMVTTPYIFHMEDDWKYFEKKDYITCLMNVLTSSEQIGQCLINRNYAETENIASPGGFPHTTMAGERFYIHEYCKTDEETKNFDKKYPGQPNCCYWPHFSFRPSLLRKAIIDRIGDFDEKVSHFEMAYSYKYVELGYVSAFLEGIYCYHIGRLTSERNDTTKLNAYILNNEIQFGDKSNIAVPAYVINLERRQDRWENFQKIVPIPVTRFLAVDGKKLKPNDQLQRIFENNDYNMRDGMVGAALSHIKLCIELLESDKEFCLIFEDDIEFVPDFSGKLQHVIKSLPKNWGICYIGHTPWKHKITPDIYDTEKYPQLEKWNFDESIKNSMGGAFGYLISKKGAEELLDMINNIGMPNCIDTMQQKLANVVDIYYCKPHLVKTELSPPDSDIQHSYVSLSLMRPGNYPERLKKNGKYDITDAIQI